MLIIRKIYGKITKQHFYINRYRHFLTLSLFRIKKKKYLEKSLFADISILDV